MSTKRQNSYLPGVILIAIGTVFLLERLDVIVIGWPFILVGIGIILLVQAIAEHRSQPVFSGTLLTLLGLHFYADEALIAPAWWRHNFASFVLITGVSFLVAWFFDRKRSGYLLTAAILLFIGIPWMFFNFSGIHFLIDWWPVLLLIVGAYLLIKPKVIKDA